MKTFLKTVVGLLWLALGLFLAGCQTQAPQASAIPWSQPANWENQIPGMGSGNMH
jgi:nitrous oxide reductase accessory protein NosL